jgi:hypothetical protein
MSKDRPKWPDSLPPPIIIIEGPRCVHLTAEDFQDINSIEDIVSDLYWFPSDNYYLFFKHGEDLSRNLWDAFDCQGIESKKTELYFYKRPNPAYSNDFIRLLPGELKYDWQINAAQGEMYGRLTLSLDESRRKLLDIAQISQVTITKIQSNQPIFELKPGLWGFNLNLRSLFRRVKVYFKKG